MLDNGSILGATFFCSRQEDDTRNTRRIFPTIAYELARRYPSVSRALAGVLKRDPDAGIRFLNQQFVDLILTPIQAASTSSDLPAGFVVVIDALDECDNQEEVAYMLSVISQHSSAVPVKFFVTSRPEREIRRCFNRRAFRGYPRFHLHDIESDIVSADIRAFAAGGDC